MIHPTLTTELEDQLHSIIPAIAAALATTTQIPGKPHNILVMGRAAFMRVPVSEANDLNYLLGTGFAVNRLANLELPDITAMKSLPRIP
jgi:hypothetical protein